MIHIWPFPSLIRAIRLTVIDIACSWAFYDNVFGCRAVGQPGHRIKDIGVGYLLEFRDPDNIALELRAAQ